jgi:hypothetical protein
MRPAWLFLVGISLLGCKDKPAATQAPAPAASGSQQTAPAAPPATPPPPAEHAAPVTAPPTDRPTLEKTFDAETEDKAWADATEAAIRAVAPELEDVACRQTQCQAKVTGAGVAQVAMAVEKLEQPDKLPSTGAKNVLLTAPTTDGAGKASMAIFIRYDR